MQKFAQRAGAVAALLALAAAAQPAFAQAKAGNASTGYAELSYLSTSYKKDSISLKPTGLRITAGADVMPGLAVEGLLAFGLKEGKKGTDQAELSTLAGVYVKPHAELAPGLEVYARAGFANMAWSTKAGTAAAVDRSGNSAGYGVGLSYQVADKITAGLDYMSYYNKSSYKLNGTAISIGMKF